MHSLAWPASGVHAAGECTAHLRAALNVAKAYTECFACSFTLYSRGLAIIF